MLFWDYSKAISISVSYYLKYLISVAKLVLVPHQLEKFFRSKTSSYILYYRRTDPFHLMDGTRRLKVSKLEAVALDMLKELFGNRSFENYLVDIVVDSLMKEPKFSEENKSSKLSSVDKRLKVYNEGAAYLIRLISSATQTFLRSSKSVPLLRTSVLPAQHLITHCSCIF